MTDRDAVRRVIQSIDIDRIDDPTYLEQLRAATEPHMAGLREEAEDERAAETVATPVVYFIRLGSRIKIGTTTDLTQRLAQLPVEEMLGAIPGGTDLERELHRRFAEHRVVGEWFIDCPAIRAFIAASIDTTEPILVDSSVAAAYLSCDEDRIRKLVAKGVIAPVGTASRDGRGGRPRNVFDLRQVRAALGTDTPDRPLS